MLMSDLTRDLLKDVPRAVRSAFIRKLSNGTEAETPDGLEHLTREEIVAIAIAEQLLIREIQIKKTRMIVRTIQLIAVLTAVVIADPSVWKLAPEALHKFLEMFFVETTVPR